MQDLFETCLEFNEVQFPTLEEKELAEDQHKIILRDLVSGESELSKFTKDKAVVACEYEFQYPFKLPFSIQCDGEIYEEIYIIGSIDLVLKDKGGNIHVIDYKSGKKKFEPKKLKTNLQLPLYSLVILDRFNQLPKSCKYYFTRLDLIQDVLPLALDEKSTQHVYYKNGNIKEEQRTVKQIEGRLREIFTMQYKKQVFDSSPTPLCSWCSHSIYYKNNCEHQSYYVRKDMNIPKENVRRRGKKNGRTKKV